MSSKVTFQFVKKEVEILFSLVTVTTTINFYTMNYNDGSYSGIKACFKTTKLVVFMHEFISKRNPQALNFNDPKENK